MTYRVAWGRGIEFGPSFSGNVGVNPGVRVTGANDVLRGDVIELAARKTVHHSGWNSNCAQHDCHGRGKVLAMSFAAFEEKMRKRIAGSGFGQLQSVSVVAAQIGFDG